MKPETAFEMTPERLITIDYFDEEVYVVSGIHSEIRERERQLHGGTNEEIKQSSSSVTLL